MMLMIYVFVGVICWVTGYIPLLSTELILAAVGLKVSFMHIIPLALLAAFCQTIAKAHIYLISNKFLFFLSFKSRRKLVRLKKQFKSREKLSVGILFTSALTGLPPYYLVNILCGLLKTGWAQFCLLGFTGMFIRFYCCLAFPNLIMQWLA